jgi:hypothetical protein
MTAYFAPPPSPWQTLTGAPAAVASRLLLPPPPSLTWHAPSAAGKTLALELFAELVSPALARTQALLESSCGGSGAATGGAGAGERLRLDLSILLAALRGSATSLCDS